MSHLWLSAEALADHLWDMHRQKWDEAQRAAGGARRAALSAGLRP